MQRGTGGDGRRTLSRVAVCIAFTFLAAGCSSDPPQSADEPELGNDRSEIETVTSDRDTELVIGLVTYRDDDLVQNQVRTAVSTLSANGGILGRRVRLAVETIPRDVEVAKAAAHRLLERDGVDVILAALGERELRSLTSVTEPKSVLVCTGNALTLPIAGVTSTAPSQEVLGSAIADAVLAEQPPDVLQRIFILGSGALPERLRIEIRRANRSADIELVPFDESTVVPPTDPVVVASATPSELDEMLAIVRPPGTDATLRPIVVVGPIENTEFHQSAGLEATGLRYLVAQSDGFSACVNSAGAAASSSDAPTPDGVRSAFAATSGTLGIVDGLTTGGALNLMEYQLDDDGLLMATPVREIIVNP